MKKVMEKDGDVGCTIIMYLIPLNYTLEMVRMLSFMLCVFYIFLIGKKITEDTMIFSELTP